MAQEFLDKTEEIEFKISLENRQSPTGQKYFNDFVQEFIVTESIDSPTVFATIAFDDSADVISTLNGADMWEIEINQKNQRKIIYKLQCYKIADYMRQEKRSVYIIHLASPEFLRNEMTNVFGKFDKKTASEHVLEIMTKRKYPGLGKETFTKKKVFTEKTKAQLNFVCPNWRVFNAVNWLCEKSVRSTGKEQAGFILYENVFGYHFTSLDQLIVDAKKQPKTGKDVKAGSNGGNRPIPPLFRYTYGQKDVSNNPKDQNTFLIDKLTFPKSYSVLDSIRHGNYSGYTQAFDPVEISKGTTAEKSKDTKVQTDVYKIENTWGKMEHLEKQQPYKGLPPWAYQNPRRYRLKVLMSKTFGPADEGGKGTSSKSSATKSHQSAKPAGGSRGLPDLVAAASYAHLRFRSFMYQQLSIEVVGNLNLYAGYGIDIEIPKNLPDKPSDKKIPRDERWSGRWMVAGVTHVYNGKLTTKLLLVRDSTPK